MFSMIRRVASAMAVATTTVLAAAVAPALGAPGALDPRFGSGGVAAPGTGDLVSFGNDGAVTTDGKLLAVGSRTSFRADIADDEGDINLDIRVAPAVVRYTADGQLDPGFGVNGSAPVYLQNHLSVGLRAAPLPDGRVLVTGVNIGLLSASTFVARLTSTGAMDTTFGGGDGWVQLLPEDMNALVPLELSGNADGTTTVVGGSFSGDLSTFGETSRRRRADLDVVLLRLTADGRLDPAYGEGGVVRSELTVADRGLDLPLDAQVLPGGGVAVVGAHIGDQIETVRGFAARYTPAGALDSSFGISGVTFVGGSDDTLDIHTGVDATANGRLLVTGIRFDLSELGGGEDSAARASVRRFTTNGQLDTSFGRRGNAALPVGMGATGITAAADGGAVIAGSAVWGVGTPRASAGVALEETLFGMGGGGSVAVLRLRSNGTTDRRFDRRGVSLVDGTRDGELAGSLVAGDPVPVAGGALVVPVTMDASLRLLRLVGDDPAWSGARQQSVTLRATGAGIRGRCGSLARECRQRRRANVHVTATARSAVGSYAVARLENLDEDGSWTQVQQRRAVVGRKGRVRFSFRPDRRGGGRYRVWVRVPSNATHVAGLSRPLFLRAVGETRRQDDQLFGTLGVAATTEQRADAACRRPRDPNLRTACSSYRTADRRGWSVREAARRFLGR